MPKGAKTYQREIFDSITGILESFVEENFREIAAINEQLNSNCLAPLKAGQGQLLSRKNATRLLQQSHKIAEQTFRLIAARNGLDSWLSLLRRFPARRDRPSGWEFITTLGLIRYAREKDSILGRVNTEDGVGIILSWDTDQLLDAFRLDFLANIMLRVGVAYRWVGKGATLRPDPEDFTRLVIPADVLDSVNFYESRRPKKTLFADQGLLSKLEDPKSDFPLLLVGMNDRGLRIHEPMRDHFLSMHYFPTVVDSNVALAQLYAYEEPINDLFGLSVDSIAHVLCAVSRLTLETFPRVRAMKKDVIELEVSGEENDYHHRVKFMFDFCQRGYLRFNRDDWLGRLSQVSTPFAKNPEARESCAKEFLDRFLVLDGQSNNIDLTLVWPVPFAFQSRAGEVYFDFTATLDFIAYIIDKSKEWYSTQHGDRFTLALKKFIEEQTKTQILLWKHKIGSQTRHGEIDLLVQAGKKFFVVECKAFAKTRHFFRGDISAVNYRHGKIRSAVKQVQETCEILRDEVKEGRLTLPGAEYAEAIVCTPSQEYLKPINEFGMLTERIPKVCTPEELIEVLSKYSA